MSEKRHFEFRYSGTTAERTVFTPTAVPMYWWDTDLAVLFVWDGTAWRRLGGVNWDNVIVVDPGGHGDYTTITAAEAAASDGDLILVVPGTYAEALDLGSTAVTIAAITPGTVTLDASAQADYAVSLSGAKDVHLYGMTITPAASHACIYAAGGAYSGTVTLTRIVVGDPGGPASILMSSGTISLDIVTVEGEVGFYGTASGGGLGNVFEERVFLAATASYSSKNDVFEGDIDANAGATMVWQGSICLGAIDADVAITYDSPVIEGGDVGIGAVPGTQLEQAGTAPYHTFWNTTEEDADGGRESRLIFEGEQSGGEHTALGWIEVCHDGAVDDEKGRLVIYLNDGNDGAAPTEVVRIDSSGYVGIGTTTPDNQLDVSGPGNVRITIQSTTSPALTGIEFKDSDQFWLLYKDGATDNFLLSDQTATTFPIVVEPSAANNSFRIDASGNVGIGTAAPAASAKLEINSVTGALLLPRMTTAQRNALTAVNGMVIYNTTTGVIEGYESGAWVNI